MEELSIDSAKEFESKQMDVWANRNNVVIIKPLAYNAQANAASERFWRHLNARMMATSDYPGDAGTDARITFEWNIQRKRGLDATKRWANSTTTAACVQPSSTAFQACPPSAVVPDSHIRGGERARAGDDDGTGDACRPHARGKQALHGDHGVGREAAGRSRQSPTSTRPSLRRSLSQTRTCSSSHRCSASRSFEVRWSLLVMLSAQMHANKPLVVNGDVGGRTVRVLNPAFIEWDHMAVGKIVQQQVASLSAGDVGRRVNDASS